MTVQGLVDKFGYQPITMPNPTREITAGYTGDLLSWVMGRLQEGSAWVTIMSNINIVAVASLADPACIILSEGVTPDANVISRAELQGVNILKTDKDSFTVCTEISSVL